jgi:PmbA protein
MDYKELASSLVKQCLKKGATDAEAYLEEGRTLDINIRNGDIESMKQAGLKGVGLRVFVKGKMAFADSSNFAKEALESVVDKAIALAKQTSFDEFNQLPSPSEKIAKLDIYDSNVTAIPLDQKISLAKEVEQLALKKHELIKRSYGAGYSDAEITIYIVNSKGISASYKKSFCGLGVAVIAADKGLMQPGFANSSSCYFNELKKPEDIASRAADYAVKLFGGKPVKSQDVPIVFDRQVGNKLLFGLINAIKGDKVYQKASFLAGLLNKPVASELITIVDDGTMDKHIGSNYVDDEGVPTRKNIIVDKGVLKMYIYNTYAAAQAGTKSTGNASRSGYDSIPGIGFTNFYMENGNMNPEDIIKEVNNGLFLMGTQGGGVNPVNGNFSTGAMGLWIADGKLSNPVANITLAGNIFDMLKGVDAIGNDLEFDETIACPTFRVKKMTIGGI